MRNPSSTAFNSPSCSTLSVRSSNRTKSTALTASIRSRGRALSASHTSYMQFFPRESVQSWRGLASHFRPPSERSRTGGRCPEWARGKMCECSYWITNRAGKQSAVRGSRKSPLVRGAYRSEARVCRRQRLASPKEYKRVRRRVCSKLHTSYGRLFTTHRRAAINFRLGVLRPPDNICDFMSMYLSNSGQTTVINIAQKFI